MLHYIRALFTPSKATPLGREDFDIFPSTSSVNSLLKLHNKQRNSKYPLTLNKVLVNCAQAHSDWMTANNKLDHKENGRSPIDRARKAGYDSYYVGENIAYGASTVEAVMDMWMNSYWHKVNILNYSYKDAGFGVSVARDGTMYWCAVFGSL